MIDSRAKAGPPAPSVSNEARRQTLRILISGASGLIGSQASAHLAASGHDVRKLVRRPPDRERGEIQWNPQSGRLDAESLAGVDAFIHLSGENIADARWTERFKRRLRDSRIISTRLLAETIARLQPVPRVLVVASAVGYYGNRDDESLTEDSLAGSGFLAELCREWEAATEPARAAGVRVVNLRLGVVLSTAGGALAKVLTPFRLGIGGAIGSGRQWMSWIALSDLVRAFEFVLEHPLAGPVNAVSPQPVTNREFTKTLGAILNRPTVMTIPATLMRVTLGAMADETVLASTRALPSRLTAAGFTFEHPGLDDALRTELPR